MTTQLLECLIREALGEEVEGTQENESSQMNFGCTGRGKVQRGHFHLPLPLLAVSRLVCSSSFGKHWAVKPVQTWPSRASCHIGSAHIPASQSLCHASFQAGLPSPSLSCWQ